MRDLGLSDDVFAGAEQPSEDVPVENGGDPAAAPEPAAEAGRRG